MEVSLVLKTEVLNQHGSFIWTFPINVYFHVLDVHNEFDPWKNMKIWNTSFVDVIIMILRNNVSDQIVCNLRIEMAK